LAVLVSAVEGEGIPIATSAHVTDLFADASGHVHGVRVKRPDGKQEDMGCDVLILACNGFGGNKDMLRQYIPEAVDLFTKATPATRAMPSIWGIALGASVKDMGSFQGHGAVATPHAVHLSWPTVTEGGFHVNQAGQRFSNENSGYSEQALHVHRQAGQYAWAIWDERGEGPANKQHSHMQANEAGAIKRHDSVASLAKAIGCDEAGFGRDICRRGSLCKRQQNRRTGARLHPQTRPASAFLPVQNHWCAHPHPGGAGDQHRHACAAHRRPPFPNLFAGGGAARGLSGPADWGYLSGSGLLMATSTGRLAGEAAAAQVGACQRLTAPPAPSF
jgi:fumarate reductase flavoprotein subunit